MALHEYMNKALSEAVDDDVVYHHLIDCIDYVITHELCHLKHADHSMKFYNFLGTVMPDWSERKLRLERILA